MNYPLLLTLIVSLFSFVSIADSKLPPLEVYSNNPEISLMTISPDGTRIAYSAIQNGRKVLLIKELATAKVLGGAVLEGLNAQFAYFIDNSRVILRAFEYKKIRGFLGKTNVSAAFVFDIETKEVRQILTWLWYLRRAI